MKIKELIKNLQKYDPDMDAHIYCEDENLKAGDEPIQIFEIVDVSENDATPSRLDDGIGKPWLKFGKGESSRKFVLIQVTSDI